MHDLSIPDAVATAPDVHALVNRGSVFACADGRRASLQQMGDGSIHVTLSFRRDADTWAASSGYDVSSAAEVKEAMVGAGGEYADWHPAIRAAVDKASGGGGGGSGSGHRSLYMLPVGFSWAHRRGVTAVGDAAHLMTPFAGEGVNVALEDALRLSRAIVGAVGSARGDSRRDTGDELDQAVAAFEKEMFARAARVAELTDEMRKAYYFTEGVPKSIIARTTALHVKFHMPVFLHPLATAAVHGYFFWKGLFQ